MIVWWAVVAVLVTVFLVLDLFVLNRKAHVVGVREALIWSGIWISLALLFGASIFVFQGKDKGLEFLTGWVIEKSLSVDNIFVFLVIFQYFAVPPHLQPKILHWGIVGALFLRLVFIVIGAALLEAFHWMIFVFGGLLLFTAFRLASHSEHGVHPERNPLIRLVRRILPVTQDYGSERFVVRMDGRLMATPLLVVLLMVESTDVVFAVDSMPAIFAVTSDPFIVFSSNVFAILGLRALYFALAGVVGYFTYLRQGLVAILAFVGAKMILSDFHKVPILASLAVIALILMVAVLASIIARMLEKKRGAAEVTAAVAVSIAERTD